MTSRERLLAALRRAPHDRTPVWIMRQAGRYLPEYRALKAKSDFLHMVRTPDLAVEVTLQPLRRFAQLDAAILFSDILVIPEALGVGYRFRDEGGIAMERSLSSAADLATLRPEGTAERLAYVYEALTLLRRELGDRKALLGFAGSPWTLACYLVEGGGSEDFPKTKALLKADPKMMHRILEILTDAVAQYLTRQFAAGADAIQIFDSWAAALTGADYEEFSLRYVRAVLERLPAGAPVILYAKGKSSDAAALAATGVPCLGVDWTLPISRVRALAGRPICLQGNLDPMLMTGTPEAAAAGARAVLADNAGDPGHVFNLGHGITPDARIETVQAVLEAVAAG
ncbi:MAG: uroporphyrinogen decarboxylase [Verrucomicrobia bacterium]|nr:uroporphyrinogen decarboxylase [Verrucomicrobiota bacterium]